ncbi:ThiF family adenylyltransferase [Lacipirellula parvula]|uniref:THIF-type NAD/FAD binding fold domain-containing protein n=1 Tax=Lacipirellula parvula TaxID=2650471 RepID=A0A5K7XBJ4_9BACT|nr:ThiF family adenylyltransferase [Lacipirellula parvula]BBO34174.1 hypothetical protein PLANPX_3786 [Lacipirellula parvula]
MVARSSVSRITLGVDFGYALLRIREADRRALEKFIFQRYPDREWGTFFRFGWRKTSWGLALSYLDGLWPGAGDLDRQTPLTTFKDQYSLRALQSAESAKELGVGVVHSHPEGYGTYPSPLDDDMDEYFAKEFAARTNGAPYLSFILQRSEASGLTFSGRVYYRGTWLPLVDMLTVGSSIERIRSELLPHQDDSANGEESTSRRLEQLIGAPSVTRLRRSVIGVVGCSGTGSPATHVLTRARAGELVLVEPQRVANSNHERFHGLYRKHLESSPLPFKVDVLDELVRAIDPTTAVTGLVGNILHENALDELLRCDIVLGCTDSLHGRVAFSDFSRHYLLPCLDVGVGMDGKSGRITEQLIEFTLYSPDLPCAFCQGRIDAAGLSYELMSDEERATREEQAREAVKRGDDPDQYWRGNQRQLHTVGYLTSTAGSMAAGYAMGMLTGAFEMPHSTMQFDIGQQRFGFVAEPRSQRALCNCSKHVGWGDAARPFRNVGLPRHWEKRAFLKVKRS